MYMNVRESVLCADLFMFFYIYIIYNNQIFAITSCNYFKNSFVSFQKLHLVYQLIVGLEKAFIIASKTEI